MKNVHSKTWSKTRKGYGVEQYDNDLIKELTKVYLVNRLNYSFYNKFKKK